MARARRGIAGGLNFPSVFLDVEPDEEEIRRDIMLLKHNISDYSKPLTYSKQIIIDDVKNTFETETDPKTGKKWPALSDRARRVPRYGILQRIETRRAMYRAATSKRNYGISRGGVYINSQSIVNAAPYAPYHQQDDTLPRAQSITQAQLTSRVIAERKRLVAAGFGTHYHSRAERLQRIKEVAVENVKSDIEDEARGIGEIPQRRFLGVSEYSQGLLVKTFDRWASDAIIIYKRGKTMVLSKRRGFE